MAKALLYWLNYYELSCKESVVNESSLRYPLSEFIERKMSGNVHFERRLDENNKQKHLDFTYKVVIGGDEIAGGVEVKYVQQYTRYTSEQQRYFDDLARLSSLDNNNENIFVVFGPKSEFVTNFECLYDGRTKNDRAEYKNEDSIVPHGIYSSWLSFNLGEIKTILAEDYSGQFEEFFNNYNISRFNRIKTQLLTLQQDENNYGTQIVAIWKVRKG